MAATCICRHMGWASARPSQELSAWGSFLKVTGAAAICMQAVLASKGKPTADVLDRARTASDLHMMIQHDGKERDAHQWDDIMTKVCASRGDPALHRPFRE